MSPHCTSNDRGRCRRAEGIKSVEQQKWIGAIRVQNTAAEAGGNRPRCDSLDSQKMALAKSCSKICSQAQRNYGLAQDEVPICSMTEAVEAVFIVLGIPRNAPGKWQAGDSSGAISV
jgi:hypothetical protein